MEARKVDLSDKIERLKRSLREVKQMVDACVKQYETVATPKKKNSKSPIRKS